MTGLIPIEQDITQRLSDAMPVYLSVVIGLAIVLLLLVFRSLVVPLTAGLGFLLSVGAAFGVTVLFWQEGLWGLVHTPGPLVSFIPIFMIGVTFGLAMDYQVFLVSRMREHFTHSKGRSRPGSKYNAVEESVIEGFSLGARVVTAAAIIMIAVFVAFIGQPLAFVKFRLCLGAAVLFDASGPHDAPFRRRCSCWAVHVVDAEVAGQDPAVGGRRGSARRARQTTWWRRARRSGRRGVGGGRRA